MSGDNDYITDDDVDVTVEDEMDLDDMIAGEIEISIDVPDAVDGLDWDVGDDIAIIQYWDSEGEQ